MGLFRPYEQGSKQPEPESGRRPRGRSGSTRAVPADAPAGKATAAVAEQPAPAGQPEQARRQPQKKGTRTPTRAEAEAARMARLHPTLSPKEQKAAERRARREAQDRNLAAVENTPERQLARDHIDSRWSLTEFTMPVMFLLIILSFGVGRSPRMQTITSGVMLAVFALWALNIIIVWRGYKKQAVARGLNPKQRGMLMYVINRMMAFRRLRRPAPRIARGESY